MKLILALMLSVSSAFAFNLQGRCQLNNFEASCQVCNTLPRPVMCFMTANGQSRSGSTLYQNATQILAPGQCAHLFVRANNPMVDPLVWADVNANCNF